MGVFDKIISDAQDVMDQRLAAERASISRHVDETILSFLEVNNKVAIERLYQVIHYFKDPQQGFDLWKKYYADGDEASLKQAFMAEDFSLWSQARHSWTTLAMLDAADHKKKGVLGKVFRGVHILLNMALNKIVMKKINHMRPDQYTYLCAFHSMREMVHQDVQSGEAMYALLQPHLKKTFETKLTTTLEGLKKAVGTPLVGEFAVFGASQAIVEAERDRFDRLAEQTYRTRQVNARAKAGLNPASIPAGQRFGIECEGFLPTDAASIDQSMELYKGLNKIAQLPEFKPLEMSVRFPLFSLIPKTDDQYNKWSITVDSSVINPLRFVPRNGSDRTMEKMRNCGMEIVSPILQGPKGGAQMEVVLATLSAMNFRTNETCGFHTHVEVADASLDELKNVAKAFIKNEEAIDQYIDPDRRGNKAHFAQSVRDVLIEAVDGVGTVDELVFVVNKGDRNSKFDITNLASSSAPQTIQYRGEGGTKYLEYAGSYANLLVNFTCMARQNPNVTVDEVIRDVKARHAKAVSAKPTDCAL